MRNLSVTTFIHVLFSMAIIILMATFLLFLSWDKDRQKIEEFKRYQLISITFLSNLKHQKNEDELSNLYENLRVLPIDEQKIPSIRDDIENRGKTIFSGGSSIGRVRVFGLDDTRYIYVQRMEHNIMLKDNIGESYNFEYAVGIGSLLIMLLLLLYVAVLKKLYPLKRLHKQIQAFAMGDINTRISYEYDDEIGKIAKSFDDAILYIHELSASKNLFMRNLMHELKTPITKGRIIVEMLENEDTKKVLVRAFERMNELISELAEIERVTTQSFVPVFEKAMLGDIIDKSQELLMNKGTSIAIDINDRALITDKKLMILVMKNLIDNGLKYGKDKSVMVSTNENRIEIQSKGKVLNHPLSYYTEPFSQGEKRSAGFGLGLYIVHNISNKLGYKLDYKHANGINIFMLIPLERV